MTAAVVGAVGKWEFRVFGEISKGVWEPVETCTWFSPASMLPPFPPRFSAPGLISVSPLLSKRPTTCGPNRIETVSSRCSCMVTVLPAKVLRNRVLSICHSLVANCDRVVFAHHALRLYREDPVQVAPIGAPKCRPFLRRWHAELAVEFFDVFLP